MFYMSDLYSICRDGELSVNTRAIPRTGWAHRLYNPGYRLRIDPVLRGTSEVLDPIPRVVSEGSRGVYIRDNRTGAVWSLASGHEAAIHGSPQSDDGFTCTFHPRRIAWDARVHGLPVRIGVELAKEAPLERWNVSVDVTDASTRPDWSVFFHTPLPGFMGHIGLRAGYKPDYGAVYSDHTEYYTVFDDISRIQTTRHVALLLSPEGITGFDTDPDSFFGPGIEPGIPRAVRRGCSGSVVEGSDAILAAELPLSALDARTMVLVWGVGAASGQELLDGADRRLHAALTTPASIGTEVSAPFLLQLPDAGCEAFLSHQLGRQIDYLARTTRGERATCIRNLLQDAQGFTAQNAEHAKNMIQLACRVQNTDGYLPHSMSMNPWNAPHGLGNLKFHDAAVWLPIAVDHYTRTSGDFAFLETTIPFADGDRGGDGASLADHLMRAIEYLRSATGAHGLPLLGDGDWNDPLNGPGRSGAGESAWLAEAFVYATKRLADLFDATGRSEASKTVAGYADRMAARVSAHCWTGTRFIRGFDDSGKPFGHEGDTCGSIFLNTQTWAVMAGIGDEDMRRTCLESVDALLDSPYGPITLAPTFPAYDKRIGKISIKPQGANENGSVYCHAAVFKVLADTLAGRPDSAADTLSKIIPGAASCRVDRTRQLPLYVPNFYYGPDAGSAAGRSSMLDSTGTAAWLSTVVSDYVFGIYPDYEGIRLRPCVAESWLPARLDRSIRGARYTIAYEAHATHADAVQTPRIFVNGTELGGTHIAYAPAGTHTDILIEIPKNK